MKRDGVNPKMPPLPDRQLFDWFVEIGMVMATGMGSAPLSWAEIAAWQHSVGVTLMPWQARLIRHLSVAYIAQQSKAESEACPPPFRTEVTQSERDAEDRKLRMVLG